MRFHFLASIRPIFENYVFWAVWEPFHTHMRPKFQIVRHLSFMGLYYRLYNAEKNFGGSGNQSAPVVQPTKRNSKKVFFLGHPRGYPERDGEKEEWEGLVLKYSRSWISRSLIHKCTFLSANVIDLPLLLCHENWDSWTNTLQSN